MTREKLTDSFVPAKFKLKTKAEHPQPLSILVSDSQQASLQCHET